MTFASQACISFTFSTPKASVLFNSALFISHVHRRLRVSMRQSGPVMFLRVSLGPNDVCLYVDQYAAIRTAEEGACFLLPKQPMSMH